MENNQLKTQKDRLIAFRESIGYSTRHFEQTIGVSNGYIKQMNETVSSKVLEQIFRAFPRLRREWLLFGEGDMCTSEQIVNSCNSNSNNNNGDNSNLVIGAPDNLYKEIIDTLKNEIEFLKEQLKSKDDIIIAIANGKQHGDA